MKSQTQQSPNLGKSKNSQISISQRSSLASKTTTSSTGYPNTQSSTKSPVIPQPGPKGPKIQWKSETGLSGSGNSGYVNIPMPFSNQPEKSTLDRTREWVASQESLTAKPLPPGTLRQRQC